MTMRERTAAAPVWLWYGEDEAGETHVSFGRWQKHSSQRRYKLAEVQPTEHDHPSTDRVAQAARVLLNAHAYDATVASHPLDAYGSAWMRGALVWLSDQDGDAL